MCMPHLSCLRSHLQGALTALLHCMEELLLGGALTAALPTCQQLSRLRSRPCKQQRPRPSPRPHLLCCPPRSLVGSLGQGGASREGHFFPSSSLSSPLSSFETSRVLLPLIMVGTDRSGQAEAATQTERTQPLWAHVGNPRAHVAVQTVDCEELRNLEVPLGPEEGEVSHGCKCVLLKELPEQMARLQ